MKLSLDTEKYIDLYSKGRKLNSHHQRFILGLSAIPLVGLLDYYMAPDKEKRNDSLSRVFAKIIIGTITGVIIRYAGFEFIKKHADVEVLMLGKNKSFIQKRDNNSSIIFFPKEFLRKHNGSVEFWEDKIENYQKALSTYLAIGVMLFTNFAVDMPLTTALTKFFRSHVFDSDKDKKVNIYETPKVIQAFSFASKRLNVSQVLKGEKK